MNNTVSQATANPKQLIGASRIKVDAMFFFWLAHFQCMELEKGWELIPHLPQLFRTHTFPSVSEKAQTNIDGKNLSKYSTLQIVIDGIRYISRIQCLEALPTWRRDEVSKLRWKNGAWGELEFKELFQVTLQRFHDTWSSVSCISCVPVYLWGVGAGGHSVPFRKLVLIANLRKESIIFLML
jgi:hypothetical protein